MGASGVLEDVFFSARALKRCLGDLARGQLWPDQTYRRWLCVPLKPCQCWLLAHGERENVTYNFEGKCNRDGQERFGTWAVPSWNEMTA